MLGSVVSSYKAMCMIPTSPKGLDAKRESTGGFKGGIVASDIWAGLEGPWEGTYWRSSATTRHSESNPSWRLSGLVWLELEWENLESNSKQCEDP